MKLFLLTLIGTSYFILSGDAVPAKVKERIEYKCEQLCGKQGVEYIKIKYTKKTNHVEVRYKCNEKS